MFALWCKLCLIVHMSSQMLVGVVLSALDFRSEDWTVGEFKAWSLHRVVLTL